MRAQKHPYQRLRHRSQFLRIRAVGHFAATPSLVIQTASNDSIPLVNGEGVTIGVTVTRRVGGSVERNRARRRLRGVINDILVPNATVGCAYVVIARKECLSAPYDQLCTDARQAMKRLGKIKAESR